MRAELDASLCIPESAPVELEIAPVSAQLNLSGKPGADVTPLKLMLPMVELTVPDVTLDLPDPTVTVTISTGTGLLPYLTQVSAFIDGIVPPQTPGEVALVGLLGLTGGGVLALGAAAALVSPSLTINVTANLGEVELSADGPLTIDFGALRLHAEPPHEGVQPMGLDVDLDNVTLKALVDKIAASLTGCLVLNGGNPDHTHPGGGSPITSGPGGITGSTGIRPAGGMPIQISRVSKSLQPPDHKDPASGSVQQDSLQLEVHGEGFGGTRGKGLALLNTQGAAYSPISYHQWSDALIKISFDPAPPHSVYALVVMNDHGISSAAFPLTLP